MLGVRHRYAILEGFRNVAASSSKVSPLGFSSADRIVDSRSSSNFLLFFIVKCGQRPDFGFGWRFLRPADGPWDAAFSRIMSGTTSQTILVPKI
jgi:hypothetical protein